MGMKAKFEAARAAALPSCAAAYDAKGARERGQLDALVELGAAADDAEATGAELRAALEASNVAGDAAIRTLAERVAALEAARVHGLAEVLDAMNAKIAALETAAAKPPKGGKAKPAEPLPGASDPTGEAGT